jgi:hypothetical protein
VQQTGGDERMFSRVEGMRGYAAEWSRWEDMQQNGGDERM